MSDRAVITVQCGNYANYVGTHFWNLQESKFVYQSDEPPPELCHDVLFRDGETDDRQVTFTPRLVAVDLKGSLGLLPELGDLYERPRVPKLDSLLWEGSTEVRKEEPPRKNDFQRQLEVEENNLLDEDKDICESSPDGKERKSSQVDYVLEGQVHFWSDFLRARYHPKTNVIVQDYQQGNSLRPFDIYGLGVNCWQDELGERIEDHVRFFAEEADSLQGFHLLVDNFSAFGGVAASFLDSLADDYPGKCVAAFPVSPCHYPEVSPAANAARFLNTILSLHSLSTSATLTSPLSLASDTFTLEGRQRTIDGVSYKPESAYHTSALLAAAFDNLSLTWRSRVCPVRLYDVASGLALAGRKVASVGAYLPFPIKEHQFLIDVLRDELPEQSLVCLTPSCSSMLKDVAVQAVCLRGIGKNQLREAEIKTDQRCSSGNPFQRCESLSDAMSLYFNRSFPSTATGITVNESTCGLAMPFPSKMFDHTLFSSNGHRLTSSQGSGTGVTSIPSMTLWQSSEGAGNHCKILYERGRRINLGRFHKFKEAGLEEDEFAEVIEGLARLSECYVENTTC